MHFRSIFDLAVKEQELHDLQQQAEAPGFWDSPEAAQKVMKSIAELNDTIDEWHKLTSNINELKSLLELDDGSLTTEIERQVEILEQILAQKETELLFSGKYDKGNAILAIHAGAGGTEAQDWAEMLERMYLRWAEKHGYRTEILDRSSGEEAGIKSVTISIQGKMAYGYLKAEKGVHRLVRLSPFDAAHRRHTSFALVEVLPELEDNEEVVIHPDDIIIEVYNLRELAGKTFKRT